MQLSRVFSLLTALVLSALMVVPAAAWEFKLSGALNFEYEHLGQMGDNGFFGRSDFDAAGAAGSGWRLNFWPGSIQPPGGAAVVSGSDAKWRTQYAEFFPVVKINKAISIHGSYYVGAWLDATALGNQFDSEYVVKQFPGAHRSFSPGYWNWMRIKVKLPWGNLSIGKRPSRYGMGLIYDGYNTGSNSVSLSVPYGPLTFGVSFYPSRRANHNGFTNPDDGSNIRISNWSWGAAYACGNIKSGFAVSHADRQRPAERQVNVFTNSTRNRHDLELKAYFKYFNGTFFFNTEGDLYYRQQLDHWTLAEQQGGNGNQIYQDHECLVYGVETGFVTGPAKLSFLLFNGSDDDRRAYSIGGGTSIFKLNNWYRISPEFGNSYTVCYPYIYLMGFQYGGGNANGATVSARGRWTSGLLLAARLDYAVAANLNLFATAAKGTQWNKSFGWGYINVLQNGNVNLSPKNNGRVRSPAIPDDDMGWEFGTGMDWKLLEGLTFRGLFAYWQPGNWWKYACVSRTNPNWYQPTADTVLWGTTPNRSIDPIFGVNMIMIGEF